MVEVLENLLESIRKRPGMYIGGTDALGLFHLHEFVLTNLLAAPTPPSHVTMCREGMTLHVMSDAVMDGARAVELLDSGVVGNSPEWEWTLLAVSAMSCRFSFEVASDAGRFRWTGAQGRRASLEGLPRLAAHGTAISFEPDPHVFEKTRSPPEPRFIARCFELATLCPGVRIAFDDPAGGGVRVRRPRGLAELLEAEGSRVEHDLTVRWHDVTARMAIGWRGAGGETRHSFVNRVRTRGGSHLQAMQDVLETRPERGEGYSGAISVEMPRTAAAFEGPTREVLRVAGLREGLRDALLAALKR